MYSIVPELIELQNLKGFPMLTQLMAVMLTDLAGHTAFSLSATRSDVAAAIRQQKRVIAPIISQYRGRIVK